MKKAFILFFFTLLAVGAKAQNKPVSLLLDSRLTNLHGIEAVTTFKNSTLDTIKLRGMFFFWLPYQETNFTLDIPPGRQKALKLQFNYPDFIYVNGFRVYNAPGGNVVCDIKQVNKMPLIINYSGDHAQQNQYYLEFNNFLKNYDNESRPYYNAGDVTKDWNKFPAIADSITQIRLDFLNSYTEELPEWFRQNEHLRLVYNGILRKDNVLFSKEFYGGKKISVSDNYFNYLQDVKLSNPGMLLNTEYLWVADIYLNHIAKKVSKPVPDAMLYIIDSLRLDGQVADLLRMRRLFALYTSAKNKFDTVFRSAKFADTTNKIITDSLIQIKLGLPRVGKTAPGFTLVDRSGKAVSFADFKEKYVMINFWASWCGPCIREFPAESTLYNRYKDKGLVVINICVESNKPTWQRISKEKDLQMINLFADGVANASLKRAYNLSSLPRSILIDKTGKVTSNYFTRASFLTDKAIAELLNSD